MQIAVGWGGGDGGVTLMVEWRGCGGWGVGVLQVIFCIVENEDID